MVRGNERQNFLSHFISTTGTSLAVSAGFAVSFRLLFAFVHVDFALVFGIFTNLANISRNTHNIFLLLYAQNSYFPLLATKVCSCYMLPVKVLLLEKIDPSLISIRINI